MTRSRPVTVAVLTIAALCTTLLGTGTAMAAPPGGQPPPSNATEKAVTIARPAVVRLVGSVKAVVEDPTGTLLSAPVSFESDNEGICTGVGINPDGYVATAGHCVDITTLEGYPGQLIEAVVQRVVAADPTKDPAAVLDFAAKNLIVRGPKPGSSMELQVSVVTGSTEAGNRPTLNAAQVVGYKSFSSGDVALLKIDVKDLPTVPLATDADLQVGSDVISIGFPGRNDILTDPTLEPSNKDGRISSKKTKAGVPFYETSAAMGPGMSGGPTVDLQGRLVGINSRVAGYDNESFSFVTTSDTLAAFMTSVGVRAESGRVDTMFRTALDAYYAGHYTAAVAGFDALLAAVPGHPQATQMRIAALGAREKYGDVPVAPAGSGLPFGLKPLLFWLIVGGAGALLLLIAALVVVRARRRKRAATALMPFPPGMPGPAYTPPFGGHGFGAPPPFPPGPPTRHMNGPMNGPGGWAPTPPSWQPVPPSGATAVLATTGTATLSGPPPCIRCASEVAPGAAYCSTCGQAQQT